jgi:putrescine transport system permease protein
MVVMGLSVSKVAEAVPPYEIFFNYNQVETSLHISPFWGNYSLVLQDVTYMRIFLNSVRMSFLATLASLIIGYPIAYSMGTSQKKYRPILMLALLIPFGTSLLSRMIAWIMLLKDHGILNYLLLKIGVINTSLSILNSEFAVILGICYTYMPFMILPIFSIIEKIDPALREAAQDLGCRPFKVFWCITLPLSLPGILTGFVFTFIPAVGDFMVPDLLGGSAVLTIGKIIWNEFFINRDWPVASSLTILFLITMFLVLRLFNYAMCKLGHTE